MSEMSSQSTSTPITGIRKRTSVTNKRPTNKRRKLLQPIIKQQGDDESGFGDLVIEDYLDPEVRKEMEVNVDEMIQSLDKETEDKKVLQIPNEIVKIPVETKEVYYLPTIEELRARSGTYLDLINTVSVKSAALQETTNETLIALREAHELSEKRNKQIEKDNQENHAKYRAIEEKVAEVPGAIRETKEAIVRIPVAIQQVISIETAELSNLIVKTAAEHKAESKDHLTMALLAQAEVIKNQTEATLEEYGLTKRRKNIEKEECVTCGKEFSRLSNLQRHFITLHEPLSAFRNFQMTCVVPDCDMRSRVPQVMEEHRKEHNLSREGPQYSMCFKMKCFVEECNFTSKYDTEYHAHLKNHVSEKPETEADMTLKCYLEVMDLAPKDKEFIKKKKIFTDDMSFKKWAKIIDLVVQKKTAT